MWGFTYKKYKKEKKLCALYWVWTCRGLFWWRALYGNLFVCLFVLISICGAVDLWVYFVRVRWWWRWWPLFSSLEHTHCAVVAGYSKRMTVAFYSEFWISTEVVYLQRCFVRYMAGATWNCCRLGAFCVHHTTMHHVTSLHAKPQTGCNACLFVCIDGRMSGILFVLLR